MGEPVTIYVTKGAETFGIRAARVVLRDEGKAADEIGPDGKHKYPRDRTHWHTEFRRTLPDAIADAERRRARRIVSLEKQLAAVRAIDLTKPIAPTPEQTGGE